MPINYSQIRDQVSRFGEQAARRSEIDNLNQQQALEQINQLGDRTDWLLSLIDRVAERNRTLRCARPLSEPLNHIVPLQGTPSPMTLIATDGSQIVPTRHRQVTFGLINIASITMRTDSTETPVTNIESELLGWDALNLIKGSSMQDFISLERDIRERQYLARWAIAHPPPVMSFSDGPLELFRETGDASMYDKTVAKYGEFLQEMRQQQRVMAGYVDKPQSDLVHRLLRLAKENSETPDHSPGDRPMETWLPDAGFFRLLLKKPGERSAIFGIQSPWNNQFEGTLRSCFFYLNVSLTSKPYLARVEIPAWCADNAALVTELQAQLYHQCEVMGTRPYPYILHRAHELALVSYQESDHLETMLAGEMIERGLDSGKSSYKQSAKDLPGRGSVL